MESAKTQVRCSHCKTWFPSAIQIDDLDTFNMARITGNLQQCPSCGKMTSCNKESVRIRTKDGGYIGKDTF